MSLIEQGVSKVFGMFMKTVWVVACVFNLPKWYMVLCQQLSYET